MSEQNSHPTETGVKCLSTDETEPQKGMGCIAQWFEVPENFGECQNLWDEVREVELKLERQRRNAQGSGNRKRAQAKYLELHDWNYATGSVHTVVDLKELITAKKKELSMK